MFLIKVCVEQIIAEKTNKLKNLSIDSIFIKWYYKNVYKYH